MLADSYYLLNYNVLKQLQQFPILGQFPHLYFDQYLFLSSLIITLFLLLIILVYILFLFLKLSCFYFIHITLNRMIICNSFMFFDDAFKIIFYIRNRVRSIRQIKFIIPSWSRNFKFVVVFRLNVLPCIINA